MTLMLQSIKNFNKFDRKTSNYILLTLFIIMIVYLMFSLGSKITKEMMNYIWKDLKIS